MSSVRPNFLIAGAARSGTTALAETLSQHPDIYVTEPKEVHFYAHSDQPTVYAGPGDDVMMNERIVDDPRDFFRLFANTGAFARRGDGSVSTFFRPEVSIGNIRRHAELGTKVIVMLREPVDRAYSSFLYLRGRGHERSSSFLEALNLEAERCAIGYHHMWLYATASEYERQLRPFAEEFGNDLLVLIFEEYRENRRLVLEKICRHLEVNDSVDFRASGSINRGGEPRSRALAIALNTVRNRPAALRALKQLLPVSLIESVKQANLKRPTVDPVAVDALRDRFDKDIYYVEKLLGREVTAWRR